MIEQMTLHEAIVARHSVRAYKQQPLAEEVVKVLEEKIAVLNREDFEIGAGKENFDWV